jgi:hypothetical protein
MKSVPRWVLVVMLAGGGASGCHREQAAPEPLDFFPLHTDDTWVYEVARPLRNEHTRMTVRARGDQFVAPLKRRCHLVEESYSADTNNGGNPETYPIAYYRMDGFLYRALALEYRDGEVADAGIGTAQERFLPDNPDANSSWESLTTAYELGGSHSYGVTQQHRATVDPQTVTVPAGTFSRCLRVDTVARHRGVHPESGSGHAAEQAVVLYYADWYAPNVGLVRTIQSSRPDGPAVAQIELVAYDVEGAQRK